MQPAALSLPTSLHSPSSFAPPHYLTSSAPLHSRSSVRFHSAQNPKEKRRAKILNLKLFFSSFYISSNFGYVILPPFQATNYKYVTHFGSKYSIKLSNSQIK